MKKLTELPIEAALNQVHRYALAEESKHRALVGQKPFGGSWDQLKHDNYHEDRADFAHRAAAWIYIELMRINPS